MKSFFKEFKEFIATGNLIELAVGLVMGLKIKDVIDSFMNGVVNPFIAGIFGKPSFDTLLQFHLGSAKQVAKDGTVSKGSLVQPGVVITSLINLALVGLVLFLILKAYNKLRARNAAAAEAASPSGPSEVELLTEIRDALRQR